MIPLQARNKVLKMIRIAPRFDLRTLVANANSESRTHVPIRGCACS